jgi:hypothetical protein
VASSHMRRGFIGGQFVSVAALYARRQAADCEAGDGSEMRTARVKGAGRRPTVRKAKTESPKGLASEEASYI